MVLEGVYGARRVCGARGVRGNVWCRRVCGARRVLVLEMLENEFVHGR